MDQRTRIGIIALVLLAAAVALLFWRSGEAEMWQSACIRIGLLMGAIWLAYPHLEGVHPAILTFGFVIGAAILIFAAKHPFQMALLAAIALLLGYFKAHPRRGRPTR